MKSYIKYEVNNSNRIITIIKNPKTNYLIKLYNIALPLYSYCKINKCLLKIPKYQQSCLNQTREGFALNYSTIALHFQKVCRLHGSELLSYDKHDNIFFNADLYTYCTVLDTYEGEFDKFDNKFIVENSAVIFLVIFTFFTTIFISQNLAICNKVLCYSHLCIAQLIHISVLSKLQESEKI